MTGYYIHHTGIPINFGITIGITLIVGTIVAGQTFYIFTLENLKRVVKRSHCHLAPVPPLGLFYFSGVSALALGSPVSFSSSVSCVWICAASGAFGASFR